MIWRRLVAVSIFGFLAILVLAQIGLVARDEPEPDVPRLEGTTIRLGLDVEAPAIVEVGRPFDVRVVATNRSGVDDMSLVVGVRAGEGLEKTVVDALGNFRWVPAGGDREHVETLVARQPGRLQIQVSAREERGWSAAGAVVELTAVEDASFVDRGAVARVQRYDLVLRSSMPSVVEDGATFPFDVAVENAGDLALDGVRIGVSVRGGFQIVGPDEHVVDRLEADARADFRTQLRVPDGLGPGARVSASSRDGRGWAAAGSVVALDAAGLVRSAR